MSRERPEGKKENKCQKFNHQGNSSSSDSSSNPTSAQRFFYKVSISCGQYIRDTGRAHRATTVKTKSVLRKGSSELIIVSIKGDDKHKF